MLVASLLATMAFQAGINPPSGVWQESGVSVNSSTESNGKHHTAGWSILADNYPVTYTKFLIYNTTAFLASLSIILLLISGLPLKRRFFMWVLMIIMWAAITAITVVYLQSLLVITPDHEFSRLETMQKVAVSVWIGLMLLLLGHTIRLIKKSIMYLSKLAIRLRNTISGHRAYMRFTRSFLNLS